MLFRSVYNVTPYNEAVDVGSSSVKRVFDEYMKANGIELKTHERKRTPKEGKPDVMPDGHLPDGTYVPDSGMFDEEEPLPPPPPEEAPALEI